MCHTITNSEQFSIYECERKVKMCLCVRDFLIIFISTEPNVELKPRQNEFISTDIFYLNKYNKIFCEYIVCDGVYT